jgi:hypothetical protein
VNGIILKLVDGSQVYYLEWGSACDAPTTYGMSRGELTAFVRKEYGVEGLKYLRGQLARVERYGTSMHDPTSAAELVSCNRAGADETELSMDQLVDYYCRSRPADGEPHRPLPHGRDLYRRKRPAKKRAQKTPRGVSRR